MKIAALPDGKIGQLDAQLRQRRISTGNKRTIECIKLSVKNGQRPYAIYDVVKFHHEPMMSLSQPEHEKMHQWTVLESERGCLFIFHKARRLDLGIDCLAQITDFELSCSMRCDPLHRNIVLNMKGSAKYLMRAG
jgi:hypothetical protein